MTSHAIEAQRQALLEQRDALLKERDRLQRELEQVRADNCDLEAEWNRLRAVNSELLAAIKGLINTSQASPAEWVEACADVAAAIARAEGEQ